MTLSVEGGFSDSIMMDAIMIEQRSQVNSGGGRDRM